MSFEWRTDEDDGWQEAAKPGETAVPQTFWQRRGRFLLVALLGMAAVWGVVQWQVDQRISEATVSLESELLGTHNFILQTAVSHDGTLFKANLSGRNPDWVDMQTTLLEDGLLLDRPMLGWQHIVEPNRLTLEEVTFDLSPDLQAAELLYPQTYAVQTPTGITETVTLQQTAVYRRGSTRWLYSPPNDDFWGDWITQGGEQLTLVYTARDREVAAHLALDLDELLNKMCSELADLNCGSDLRVHMRLDTDPESLLETNQIETMLKAGLRLNLPTPTLVGLPTDEASYEALYRAYGVQLATAVLAHQIEYDCCRHELFFRALRDYQLAQLGLQAWPLEEAMYAQMLAAGFDGQVMRHWTRRWEEAPPQFLQVWKIEDPDPIWQQVYMLIDYLNEQETAVSPTEMMRLLSRNSFHGWATDVLRGKYDLDLFPTQFLEYIYAQSSGGQQAVPPVPFPTGEIVLVCNDYQYELSTGVYAFDLASNIWVEKFTDLDLPRGAFINSQDGEHFLVTEINSADSISTNRIYLVTKDSKLLLEEFEMPYDSDHYLYYDIWNSAANYLVRFEYEEGIGTTTLRSLDCPTSGCPEIELAGYPSFSPNGQYLIDNVPVAGLDDSVELREYELLVVSLDGKLRQLIGKGRSGFWLNDEMFGIVQVAENGWVLSSATLSEPEPQFLFDELNLLAEVADVSSLSINFVFLLPDTQQLILQAQAGDDPDNPQYVFRLWLTNDLAAVDEVELLWKGQFGGGVGYSPDGRYLILTDYNYASSSAELSQYLLDLETLQVSEPITSRGYAMSWSPDGQWFVQNTENYVLLHAPAYDYQYYIPHGLGDCQQALLSVDE